MAVTKHWVRAYVANHSGTDPALAGRVDTAETDIDALQAADSALDGRLDTVETDVAGLQTSVAGKLAKASNLSDLSSASAARTNLGLGGAAVLNVGTAAGTVAAGDDSRVTGAAQKSANLSDLGNVATARTNLGVAAAPARTTAQVTTGSLANGASEDVTFTLAKGYRIISITTSRAARVRVYTTAAARTADASRATTADPAADAGVILDYVTSDTSAHSLSPQADGSSLESSPSASISASVTNMGSTGTVTVTLTYLATEV